MLDSDDALSAELIQQGNICGALNNWKKKKKKKRRSGLNQQALSPTLLSRPLSLFSARDRQKEKKKNLPGKSLDSSENCTKEKLCPQVRTDNSGCTVRGVSTLKPWPYIYSTFCFPECISLIIIPTVWKEVVSASWPGRPRRSSVGTASTKPSS